MRHTSVQDIIRVRLDLDQIFSAFCPLPFSVQFYLPVCLSVWEINELVGRVLSVPWCRWHSALELLYTPLHRSTARRWNTTSQTTHHSSSNNERQDLVRRANTIDWHWKAHSPFHMPTHTLLGLHYQFGSFQPSSAATLSDYVIALLSGTTRPTAEQWIHLSSGGI